MPTARQETNRRMLRVRDAIDRGSHERLDIAALARVALSSEAHFIRSFRDTFGETPHRYLQRRRIERAMTLLRTTDAPITMVGLDVGFTSSATFSRTFREIVGQSPTEFRARGELPDGVPTCFVKAWTRPSSFGTARFASAP